jgi:hypothetical protein
MQTWVTPPDLKDESPAKAGHYVLLIDQLREIEASHKDGLSSCQTATSCA